MNTGKIFEQDFKESCKHQNLWCWRIRDSYVSAKAVDANAYIPCQPADFLVKLNENIFFCELKYTEKKYITIEHDNVKGMIKKTQIDQMKALQAKDVFGVLFLSFSECTYAMSIDNFLWCMGETGKHSISPIDVVQHGRLNVPDAILRTHKRYDVKTVLTKIVDLKD